MPFRFRELDIAGVIVAELDERRAGPTLSPDDLLDFHLLLQTDGWFEALAEEVARSVEHAIAVDDR